MGFIIFFHMSFSDWLVVSNILYFHPYLGKISILTNIFQMGWNHHLGDVFLGDIKSKPRIFKSFEIWVTNSSKLFSFNSKLTSTDGMCKSIGPN